LISAVVPIEYGLVMSLEDEVKRATSNEIVAYLQGALKDGTFNRLHRTHRIGQRERSWIELLQGLVSKLGSRSWIYREGQRRNYWILETGAPFLSTSFDASRLVGQPEGLAYARGFFDSEGGVPRDADARFYVQFVQKDRLALDALRQISERDGHRCGRIHNPSVMVDPGYWRFYVSAASHASFIKRIGSWHPRKRPLLENRIHAR
jgi:hypothetical protein